MRSSSTFKERTTEIPPDQKANPAGNACPFLDKSATTGAHICTSLVAGGVNIAPPYVATFCLGKYQECKMFVQGQAALKRRASGADATADREVDVSPVEEAETDRPSRKRRSTENRVDSALEQTRVDTPKPQHHSGERDSLSTFQRQEKERPKPQSEDNKRAETAPPESTAPRQESPPGGTVPSLPPRRPAPRKKRPLTGYEFVGSPGAQKPGATEFDEPRVPPSSDPAPPSDGRATAHIDSTVDKPHAEKLPHDDTVSIVEALPAPVERDSGRRHSVEPFEEIDAAEVKEDASTRLDGPPDVEVLDSQPRSAYTGRNGVTGSVPEATVEFLHEVPAHADTDEEIFAVPSPSGTEPRSRYDATIRSPSRDLVKEAVSRPKSTVREGAGRPSAQTAGAHPRSQATRTRTLTPAAISQLLARPAAWLVLAAGLILLCGAAFFAVVRDKSPRSTVQGTRVRHTTPAPSPQWRFPPVGTPADQVLLSVSNPNRSGVEVQVRTSGAKGGVTRAVRVPGRAEALLSLSGPSRSAGLSVYASHPVLPQRLVIRNLKPYRAYGQAIRTG